MQNTQSGKRKSVREKVAMENKFMNPNILPTTITKVVSDISKKPLASFGELISLWLFGKSIGQLEAQKQIASEKELTTWEVEKPWFQKAQEQKFIREYSNLGAILVESQPLLQSEINHVEKDNDVFYGLLEHAKDISDSEMQSLLARIIAGEYNNPKTYSMGTLHVLKSIDSKTLSNFADILSIAMVNSGIFKDSFSDVKDMEKLDVSYTSFLDLQNIGLISSNESRITTEGELMDIYINKKVHFIRKNVTDKIIVTPDFYSLTRAGREIGQHLKIKENPNFIKWLKERYNGRNFTIEVK